MEHLKPNKLMDNTTTENTGIILILIVILNGLAHLLESIQPFLSSVAALLGIIVAAMSIIINAPKFIKQLKAWFKN